MKELKTEFTKEMYVGYEYSHTPTIEREKKTMSYTIVWDKSTERGWFEMYDLESGGDDYYAEGGLWFDGRELIDYDGVFQLDENIEKWLKRNGAKIEL